MPHQFDPTILREYDIRGIVGSTLFPADARAIGQGFGSVVRERGGHEVCVGRDGRLSSPELAAALTEGLVAAGCRVRSIGLGPTPMLYYAAKAREADGAIMVTGSHNPGDHNGFKMVLGGKPFFGPDIAALAPRLAEGRLAEGAGAAVEDPVFDEYIERLALDYDGARGLKVVWDCGNGATGAAVEALTARLPGRHILLYTAIDGSFPHHHPDPTVPANLEDLRERVVEEGADLGVAFDGDGDRLGVVDGLGRILWGDQILALLAEDLLKDHPGATVIADVKASQVLFDEVSRLGGRALMGRTGHSLIKTMMAETGALLAGEMSGHLFFADRYYGFDDALYAAVRLIGMVARSTETLAHRRDRLPVRLNTPELRFDCAEERKQAVVAEVRARLDAAGQPYQGIDGVRVPTADGWWLLRASNTQAVLVARCEASSPAGLVRVKADLAAQLAQSGIEAP